MRSISSKMKTLKGWQSGLLLALLFSGFFVSSAQAIARGYTSDDTGLQTGMMVALSASQGDSKKVERASIDNSQQVVGVVTTIDDSFVSVASGKSKVLVESEGQVEVYVSDVNGEPKRGDLLTASPFRGILMKANQNPSSILAIASADFSSSKIESYSIDDKGATKETKIARIKANLNRQGANNVPIESDSALARLGRAIVGRDVGEVRVVVALVIFIIVLIAEGSILYGAISSAITALGRNPLAKKVIRQELVRVIVVALLVLGFGLGTIYAILWV
jgi:hypothetical protein